jgi:hypothetical protein
VICFVAVHTWKPKDFVTMGKKVLGALTSRPKGITLCSSYVHNTEDWCVYSAESKETGEKIKAFLTVGSPEMTTEVTQVLQFFPTTRDMYALIHKLIEVTTK